jgi:alanine racemase
MSEALRLKATVVLSDITEARALARAARSQKTVAAAHLKIDTGMGRLGAWHEQALEVLAAMEDLEGLQITGLCTHFAGADDDAALTRGQWKHFLKLQPHFGDKLIHAANSPALSRFPTSSSQAVRAGLMLYGFGFTKQDQAKLTPVMTWKTRITFLREVPAGRTISYGSTYTTPRKERLATLTAGYGDGYFRAQSNRASVLIGGVRCPVRGRVTMDQIVVDVTRVPGVRVGDEAVLLGRQGRAEITAQELADQAGTIPWEILTNVSSRVDRRYRDFRSKVL